MTKKKKHTKNPEAYCEVLFNSLSTNRHLWGTHDACRPITRLAYEEVFSSGNDPYALELISERALALKPAQRCQDHYLSPQFLVGRMIMDNQEKYLDDYDKFKDIFFLARRTITVTKTENSALSTLTYNRGGYDGYEIYVPTDKKYDKIGISLLTKTDKEGEEGWTAAAVKANPPIPFATEDAYGHPVIRELLRYEEDYLCEMDLKREEKFNKKWDEIKLRDEEV
ncbi:hypothetical protein HN801_01485 [Candidatus Peregrinibacteria bacterium]|jgi:hypothetical protein|nr:hypothetical protein [Candidatus Peregrinibacteria bacterium]